MWNQTTTPIARRRLPLVVLSRCAHVKRAWRSTPACQEIANLPIENNEKMEKKKQMHMLWDKQTKTKLNEI